MLNNPKIIEGILVATLFLGYPLLWAIKRKQQQALTGKNPEVMYHDQRPTQFYFARLSKVMTAVVILLILLHTAGLNDILGFYYVSFLDVVWINGLGFVVGLIGLTLCWLAQRTMGNAWRVGIDKENETPLLMSGVFQFIRNPTYSGLFLLCFGVWLIFPTFSFLTWCLLFFVMIEFQVREEEEHLLTLHGETYQNYTTATKRYIPSIY